MAVIASGGRSLRRHRRRRRRAALGTGARPPPPLRPLAEAIGILGHRPPQLGQHPPPVLPRHQQDVVRLHRPSPRVLGKRHQIVGEQRRRVAVGEVRERRDGPSAHREPGTVVHVDVVDVFAKDDLELMGYFERAIRNGWQWRWPKHHTSLPAVPLEDDDSVFPSPIWPSTS